MLAAHGIYLQRREEVVTHVKFHFRSGAYCREVKHFSDRVGGGPHAERVGDVGLATRAVGYGDGHIVTASFGEEIVKGITT